jgi:hypothetical protein
MTRHQRDYRAASQPWIDTCLMLAVVIAVALVY